MEVTRASMVAAAMLAPIFAVFSRAAVAQSAGPAPAPAPTSDGTAIDQGIAYVLMLLALVPAAPRFPCRNWLNCHTTSDKRMLGLNGDQQLRQLTALKER
ncbi:arabinogalactan protein 41 [Actinidia rufa]|uniref:Arabinogalactan protein 41 n=1 Tax=Actinidia rufa TaxID=165716 RepID=A0A7J0DC49_9ERIC|nr:arabinogalactan protein 41 [Actinidia rufa]